MRAVHTQFAAATFRPTASVARIRTSRGRAAVRVRATLDDETVQFMIDNLSPWIKDVEGANKSYEYMLREHNRRFNLDKARKVIEQLKTDHAKIPGNLPFKLPKTWPGMLLVLERCGDLVE
jgi:hypothetical protein